MTKRLALCTLALLLATTIVACGSNDPAPVEPTPGEATGIDGATVLQEKCTVCHDTARIEAAEYDAVGWAAVIDLMIEKGADVSNDEAAALAEYLALQ